MQPTIVLKDVRIPGGRVADITLDGKVVTHVGSSGRADTVIRCSDLTVIPAGVDMHVHMRDGVQSDKEDWGSGSKSALAGGVTVVVDQPNTIPAVTTPEIVKDRARLAGEKSYCQYGINGGVTPDADFTGMAEAGVMAFGETFAGPSSYGEALSPEELEIAMHTISSLHGLITIHAEVVTNGNDDTLQAHDRLRPITGEQQAIAMVQRVAPPGSRIHFCHISSADSITAIRSGMPATIEVTPHHLFLAYDAQEPENTWRKVNPPIRSEQERKRMWSHWDQIDVIASDHAPHSRSDKSVQFIDAPSGIPGVETMIPLLMAEAIAGTITISDLIAKTSTTPSKILGIPAAGYKPGMRADFALYPDHAEKIESDTLSSRAGWTPFEGMKAVFPEQVIMAGCSAYNQGEFSRTTPEWFRGRGYNQSR